MTNSRLIAILTPLIQLEEVNVTFLCLCTRLSLTKNACYRLAQDFVSSGFKSSLCYNLPRQDLESVLEPEQVPPFFSTIVLDLDLDCFPELELHDP